MKKFDFLSLVLGVVLGLILAGAVPCVQRVLAEDDKKTDTITKEEYNRQIDEFITKVDEALAAQQKTQAHLNLIQEQSEFLKKVTGK